jgi:hypothetical protein
MAEDLSVPTELLSQWLQEPEYVNGPARVELITMTTQRLKFLVDKAASWGSSSNPSTSEGDFNG